MDSSKIPPKPRFDSTDSETSLHSGISSPPGTPEAFSRETHSIPPSSRHSVSGQDKSLPEPSYKNLEQRKTDKPYVARFAGEGWDRDLQEKLQRGTRACAAYSMLADNISAVIRNPQADKALQEFLVLCGGRVIPGTLDGKTILPNMREQVVEQMGEAGLLDAWMEFEACAKEFLQYVAVGAALVPLSTKEMDEVEGNLQSANADVYEIMMKRSGSKASSSEKAKIAKREELSKRFFELQEEYETKLKQKVSALEPAKAKLDLAVDRLTQLFRKEYAPCLEAARSDVVVPKTPTPAEKETVLEVDKVKDNLRFSVGTLPEKFIHFAKAYYGFHAEGGRARLIKKEKGLKEGATGNKDLEEGRATTANRGIMQSESEDLRSPTDNLRPPTKKESLDHPGGTQEPPSYEGVLRKDKGVLQRRDSGVKSDEKKKPD